MPICIRLSHIAFLQDDCRVPLYLPLSRGPGGTAAQENTELRVQPSFRIALLCNTAMQGAYLLAVEVALP